MDPDNRRAVDYELRRRLLNGIAAKLAQPRELASELLETYADGRVKLFVTHVALQLRKREPELFAQGDYAARAGDHAVAFKRAFEDKRVVCVVRGCLGGWLVAWGSRCVRVGGPGRVGVGSGRYRELFSGELLDVGGDLRLAQLFSVFPSRCW